ncbi:hypothetical protein PtB15_8B207 [Puccinia triticina]|nr:hypothetical protein PtB15_8B207 [Puccinia triticina]
MCHNHGPGNHTVRVSLSDLSPPCSSSLSLPIIPLTVDTQADVSNNQTSMATKPNPNPIKTGCKKMPENTTTNETEVPTKPKPKPIKTGRKELPSQPIPAADSPKRQTSGRRS